MGQNKNHSGVAFTGRRIVLSVLVAAVTVAGQGIASAQAPMPGHQGMAASSTKGGSKAPMKMHAAMEGMQAKMSAMKMTGMADADFAMMMVAHHQAAIDMAKAELESGKDREMLKIAKKVVADQTKEIAKLEAWLKKNHPM